MVLIIHSIKILETIPHQVSRGQTTTNQKRWLLKMLSCMIQISVYQKPQKVIQTNHCQISKVQIVAKTMGKDSNIISDFNSCAVFLPNHANRSQKSKRCPTKICLLEKNDLSKIRLIFHGISTENDQILRN